MQAFVMGPRCSSIFNSNSSHFPDIFCYLERIGFFVNPFRIYTFPYNPTRYFTPLVYCSFNGLIFWYFTNGIKLGHLNSKMPIYELFIDLWMCLLKNLQQDIVICSLLSITDLVICKTTGNIFLRHCSWRSQLPSLDARMNVMSNSTISRKSLQNWNNGP